MRRTAIGVGAAATLGGVASTSAAAISLPSRETVLTAAGIAISPPLMGAKYVYDRVTDTGTGEDINDELAALNAEEAHTSIRQDGMEMYSVDDRVLTSIRNVVDGLDRRSYQKGIEAALTELNLGSSESAVRSAAQDAAMNVIATTQKNFIDHLSIQTTKLSRLAGEMVANANLSTNIAPIYDQNGQYTTPDANYYLNDGTSDLTTTLVNGVDYTYTTGTIEGPIVVDMSILNMYNDTYYRVEITPVSTGSNVPIFDWADYQPIWSSINSIATTVESEIDTWVTEIYPKYEAGDVNLDNLVTADMLQATSSEQNDLSNVTADFASLGIPINNRTTLTIEIVAGENSGTIIDGNLAVQNPPTDGFIVGDTYDPANITGPVWLMYDRTTDSGEVEGDVYQLESQFKVIDAEGYDGEPVSNVTFEEKTQERYSTDIQELNAQLDKLAEYQQEIQEERDALIEEETTAGGGGGNLGSDQNWGLIAVGAGVVALGWGYVTGDDQ